jgi:HTH-type transcriptional regulator / antitoxin HipB
MWLSANTDTTSLSANADKVRLPTYADTTASCELRIHMRVNSIHDLASAARGRRLELGVSQAEIAARAGVSRDWVNSFEGGKPTVELILVLRILEVLGLRLELADAAHSQRSRPPGSVDLDALLDEYRQP